MAQDLQTTERQKLIAAGFREFQHYLFHGNVRAEVLANGTVRAQFVGDDMTADALLCALRLDKR